MPGIRATQRHHLTRNCTLPLWTPKLHLSCLKMMYRVQKDEQESNRPILPSHKTRQRPFRERQWKWSTWSASSSSLVGMDRIGILVGFLKVGRGNDDSFASDGRGNSTPHRARFTRANFSPRMAHVAALRLLSQNSHPRAHVMVRTLLDPALFSSTLSTPTSSSLLFCRTVSAHSCSNHPVGVVPLSPLTHLFACAESQNRKHSHNVSKAWFLASKTFHLKSRCVLSLSSTSTF